MSTVAIDTKETTLNPFVPPTPAKLPDTLSAALTAAQHLGDPAVASSLRYLRTELYKRREEVMSRIDAPGAVSHAVHLDAAYQTYTRLLTTIRDEQDDPGLYGAPYLVELAAVADGLAQRGGLPINVATRLKHLRDVPVPHTEGVYA
ncbi:hypothetical protein [Streptomyces pseudogriseolus]|uniref:hypothetical protein n=1 Tax=Streptomyces pseudogriseolus TaxID=36817 RepID=UPI003FA29675